MSAPGPESVPTSADPRSKRPVKKRALSPASQQAAQLEGLFKRPDQDIRIPDPAAAAAKRRLPLPPEIVTNVQGSSAGAGSGEFHVYKAARRREYERLRVMDEETKAEEAQKDFEARKRELEEDDRRRTEKNRAKRLKKRAGKDKGKGAEKKAGAESGGIQPRTAANTDGQSGTTEADKKDDKTPEEQTAAAKDTPGLLIHDDD